MKFKINPKGFAAVEAVLIVVIVVMLAGVGYYVWHAKQQATATLNTASKSAQSSPAKQDLADLSDTTVGDPGKHVQVQVPKSWTATILHGAGSGQCSFETATKPVEDSCLINVEISSDAKPDTVSMNFKVFHTSDNVSAWRTASLATGCKEVKQIVNGNPVGICTADSTQSFSDYVISDGHYLAYLESNGTNENFLINEMIHSIKFAD